MNISKIDANNFAMLKFRTATAIDGYPSKVVAEILNKGLEVIEGVVIFDNCTCQKFKVVSGDSASGPFGCDTVIGRRDSVRQSVCLDNRGNEVELLAVTANCKTDAEKVKEMLSLGWEAEDLTATCLCSMLSLNPSLVEAEERLSKYGNPILTVYVRFETPTGLKFTLDFWLEIKTHQSWIAPLRKLQPSWTKTEYLKYKQEVKSYEEDVDSVRRYSLTNDYAFWETIFRSTEKY